jgi:hypothetical protein
MYHTVDMTNDQIEAITVQTLQHNLKIEMRFDCDKKLIKAYLRVLKDTMPYEDYKKYKTFIKKELNNEDPF